MKQKVVNLQGSEIKEISLSTKLFGTEFNGILLKEVIEYQRSKARQATYGTKNRSKLAYSTKKMARQKGRGMARVGQRGPCHHRGGSVAFGPDGRKYDFEIPKKKIKQALSMCLSQKLRDQDVIFVDQMDFPEIKTKQFCSVIESLNLPRKTLFIDVDKKQNFFLSMRNVVNFDFIPTMGLNPLSIVKSKKLVITEEAVKALENRYENK